MKKGISLIVLVITIIVMIVLAATVVISLSNTGIIDKASQAVNLTDEKQVQDLAALLWAEAYLDPAKKADIVNVVTQELAKQGVTTTDWNIEITNSGVSISKKGGATKLAAPIVEDGPDHHEVKITYDGPATKFNVYMDGAYCETITKTDTITIAKVQKLVEIWPYNCGGVTVEITAAADGYEESDKVEVHVTFCDD